MLREKYVGIVGMGYVGKAMYNFFCDHYSVRSYDKIRDVNTSDSSDLKKQVNECDVGVVCVPTPTLPDGGCDLSAVEEVIEWLETPIILLKSTVEVGITDWLKKETGKRIVFSPEYCGESSYWSPYAFDTDIKETPFFVFGGDKEDTSAMVDFFLPITGPVKRYCQTNAKTAEMTKYVENTFFATKIMFCYEISEICKRAGVDFNEMRELWLLDPRVNPMHTAVFQDNDRPFGGKCLPKDLNALINYSIKVGYNPELLAEVLKSNARIKPNEQYRKDQ